MDPEVANLNLDPPKQPSPLRRGLLPALLVHVAFFAALALSLQWNRESPSEALATRGIQSDATQSDTRTMGAAPTPAPGVDPATTPDTQQPAAATPAPVAPALPVAPPSTSVAPVQSPPAAPARASTERRGDARPRAAAQPVVRATAGVTPVARTEVRPSFDCAKAHSRNERLICSDSELATLDRETGRLHARAKAAARNSATFRRENDAAWKQREARCRDKSCLLAWYAQRRAQLQQVVAKAR